MSTSQNSLGGSIHGNPHPTPPHVVYHPQLFPTNPPQTQTPPPPDQVDGVPISPPQINVILKSQSPDDEGTIYAVGIYDPMYIIFNDYAIKTDTSPWMIAVYFNGVWVHPRTLAGQLGLYPYCTLIVVGQVPFINLNTNVKAFTIEEVRTVAVHRQFKLHKHTTILQLVYMWAHFMNIGPDWIILLRDQDFVYPHKTISSASMKNGDRLFAFVKPSHFS